MLSIQNLSHVYPGGVHALDGVSLEIPQGMFGLLGPNGAGKSTLMRCIATLQTPTSGAIRFGDIDVIREPEKLRRILGYLPQDFGVYPRVSAYDMLDHMAVLKGVTGAGERRETVEALLNQVNLWAVRKKAIAGFSGGMRQRFGIAQALIGRPALAHRRRAHRRPRPGGAQPLPQSPGRNRRACGGDPLHPHRGGRVRPLPAHGDHRRRPHRGTGRTRRSDGRAAGPDMEEDDSRAELDAYRAGYTVISTRLVAGQPVIHVLADHDPGDGFVAVPAGLEDVYFSTLSIVASRGLTPCSSGSPAFELRYQLRSPCSGWRWSIFFLLTFAATTVSQIQIGSLGAVHKNSPFAIANTLGVMSLFFIFALTAFVANIVVRDDETGFGADHPRHARSASSTICSAASPAPSAPARSWRWRYRSASWSDRSCPGSIR